MEGSGRGRVRTTSERVRVDGDVWAGTCGRGRAGGDVRAGTCGRGHVGGDVWTETVCGQRGRSGPRTDESEGWSRVHRRGGPSESLKTSGRSPPQRSCRRCLRVAPSPPQTEQGP